MAEKANGKYKFSVVGATGAVGREAVKILAERKFPIESLQLLASERSAGQRVEFNGSSILVKKLEPGVFDGTDLAFFTAGGSVSKEFAPMAADAGAIVVDNTSAFRMDEDVPLAVPEVNPGVLAEIPHRRIVSVPNCTTVQLVVAVAPLHKQAKIQRIIVSTYQSTSGAGRGGMEELSRQVSDLYHYREVTPDFFPHRIAFNLLPAIGEFDKEGNSAEEIKISQETQKIFNDRAMGVSATTVRVPTFHGHAESINIETEESLSAAEARDILSKTPGIVVIDEPQDHLYPLLNQAQGEDSVFVGRIRKDPSRENCLNLWVVADNLRKGAALNGIQIFETMIRTGVV